MNYDERITRGGEARGGREGGLVEEKRGTFYTKSDTGCWPLSPNARLPRNDQQETSEQHPSTKDENKRTERKGGSTGAGVRKTQHTRQKKPHQVIEKQWWQTPNKRLDAVLCSQQQPEGVTLRYAYIKNTQGQIGKSCSDMIQWYNGVIYAEKDANSRKTQGNMYVCTCG